MAAKPTVHTVKSLRARCIEEGECLIWQGYTAGRSPMVYDATRMVSVRKLFTRLLRGSVKDDGYYVSICGDDLCVEPKHTTWRSQAQHASRMGIAASVSASAQQRRRARISNTKRSISLEAVHDICTSNETVRALAAKHGISPAMVQRYRAGKSGVSAATNPFAALLRN